MTTVNQNPKLKDFIVKWTIMVRDSITKLCKEFAANILAILKAPIKTCTILIFQNTSFYSIHVFVHRFFFLYISCSPVVCMQGLCFSAEPHSQSITLNTFWPNFSNNKLSLNYKVRYSNFFDVMYHLSWQCSSI